MSYFFANILGILLTIVGIGVLVNLKNVPKIVDGLVSSPALMHVTGIWIVIFGALMILFHNVWISGWPVIITIIGWLTLLKGALFLIFPGVIRASKSLYKNTGWGVFAGIVALVLGLYFLYLIYGGMFLMM